MKFQGLWLRVGLGLGVGAMTPRRDCFRFQVVVMTRTWRTRFRVCVVSDVCELLLILNVQRVWKTFSWKRLDHRNDEFLGSLQINRKDYKPTTGNPKIGTTHFRKQNPCICLCPCRSLAAPVKRPPMFEPPEVPLHTLSAIPKMFPKHPPEDLSRQGKR